MSKEAAMGMRRVLLAVGCVVALAGCYTTKMYYASEVPSRAVHKATVHSFIFGMATIGEVNIEGLCGQAAVAGIQTQLGPVGVLLQTVTFGIYTPITVTVTCSARDGSS